MRRIVKGLAVLLAGGAAAVAVASGGGGPTTVGDAGFHVNSSAYDDAVFVQAVDSNRSPTYAVPAGGGVITSWTVQFENVTAEGDIELKLFEPLGGDSYKLVGEATGHALIGEHARTYPARISVAGGVRLGIRAPSSNTSVGTDFDGTVQDPGDIRIKLGDPAIGSTLTVSEFAYSSRLALSAVVEPDADQDGWGDTSQDACPADPGRHAAPCVTDLSLTLGASPATIAQGGAAVVSGVVNATLSTASGATATAVLPPGLELIAGQASGGACGGTVTVTCPLGDVAPGAPANAVLAVRGIQPGAQPVAASVASSTPDADAGNDGASATIAVTAAPPPPERCVVPPLRGLTRKGARKLLKAFSCALGKVTVKRKPRHGRLRVRSSRPRAASRAAAGTKVAITLKRVP
jgi:Domain of unknown function DUF11